MLQHCEANDRGSCKVYILRRLSSKPQISKVFLCFLVGHTLPSPCLASEVAMEAFIWAQRTKRNWSAELQFLYSVQVSVWCHNGSRAAPEQERQGRRIEL